MLCRRCASLTTDNPARTSAFLRCGSDAWQAVLCSRCGSILPADGQNTALVAKLSQLARFGLAGDARPLLESTGTAAEDV
ncbi:MAG: hypothetical protein ACREL9_12220 [Gemmatimonadales bacterium]